MNGNHAAGVTFMAGRKPDYTVYVSRTSLDDKAFYTAVGSAWNVAKEGISINLQALPTDGKLVLFPRKDGE
jgi:hypothetical protein